MPFEKLEQFSKKVSDLADTPSENMTPTELKSVFDSSPEELRVALNNLVDGLNANTAAETLGAKDADGNNTNIQSLLSQASGGIKGHKEAAELDHPDSSVTTRKLAPGSVTRDKVASGAIGTNELDPAILGQPKTDLEIQVKFQQHDELLADIGTNAKSNFGVKGDSVSDDTVSLTNALKSSKTTILLPDGVFKITDTMLINTGSAKRVIGSKNTIFSVNLPSTKTLLDMSVNIAFENITFDFNNGFVGNGLLYRENLGKISLKNCIFKNVKDTTTTYGSSIVYIANNGNNVDIDGLTFTNMLKQGNGVIGDAGGALNCLFVTDLTTVSVINGGTIKNIRFEEIHNIDANGSVAFEDTTGIFIASGLANVADRTSNMVIQNIYGYNFGKRLIKAQVGSLTIDKVYGKSVTGDSISVIGVMDCQNILMSNIRAYGKVVTAISTTCKNTVMNNVEIDIQKGTLAGVNAYGVEFGIGADNSILSNFNIKAERAITFYNTVQALKNITINNGAINIPDFGFVGIQFRNGSYGFDGLLISNISLDNNSVQTGTSHYFLDASYLTGSGKTGSNLQVYGITINSNATVQYAEYMFYLLNITKGNIRNVNYKTGGTVQQWRAFYVEKCTSFDLKDISTPYVNTAILLKDCVDISMNNVKTENTSTYVVNSANSTKVRLIDVDKSKVYLADAASIQNTFYNQDFSSGITANRPVSPTLGFQYYDTTLNKPVWWSGTTWKDSAGTNA